MASNPPSDCCAHGFKHDGEIKGSLINFAGYNTYVSGDKTSKNVLLLINDVFGPVASNNQLVADRFAAEGFYVIAPDVLGGDFVPLNVEGFDWGAWLSKHTVDEVEPVVHKVLAAIKSELKPSFIASMGYCFGAKYVIRLLGDELVDVGGGAHPSFITLDEVKAVKKPLVISAAEVDEIFTASLRAKTEATLAEIGAHYFIGLHSGVEHGFCNRGNVTDPHTIAQATKAFNDQVWFFNHVRKTNSANL